MNPRSKPPGPARVGTTDGHVRDEHQLALPMTGDAGDTPRAPSPALVAPVAPATNPVRMLRLRHVCQATGLGRSTIYLLESEGRFPHRVQMSERAVAWIESEVQAWIATRIAGRNGNAPSLAPIAKGPIGRRRATRDAKSAPDC